MKRAATTNIPVHDYGMALKRAVSWLGDRYLLAEPVTRRHTEPAAYFQQPRRWHAAVRQAALIRH